MKNKSWTTLPKEVGEFLTEICSFFLSHSVIELDGEMRSAKITYNGPSGWKISVQTSQELPAVEAENVEEM